MNTLDLKDNDLSYWVARAHGMSPDHVRILKQRVRTYHCEVHHVGEGYDFWSKFEPHSDWNKTGQIILREHVSLMPLFNGDVSHDFGKDWYGKWGKWHAELIDANGVFISASCRSPLRAVLLCFVLSKFGDTVEQPPITVATMATSSRHWPTA